MQQPIYPLLSSSLLIKLKYYAHFTVVFIATSKHGLQSLGKSSVVVRRMPPPANLPSIKSQIEPDVNLVPTGGQGWGSQAANNEQSALNQQQVAAANVSQGANLQKVSTAPSVITTGPQAGQAGGWKTTDVVEPPSSYNSRDFPHLVGDGDGATRGSQRGMQQSSSQPSLRPQSKNTHYELSFVLFTIIIVIVGSLPENVRDIRNEKSEKI